MSGKTSGERRSTVTRPVIKGASGLLRRSKTAKIMSFPIPGSSAVEHATVNRVVVGSIPTRGAIFREGPAARWPFSLGPFGLHVVAAPQPGEQLGNDKMAPLRAVRGRSDIPVRRDIVRRATPVGQRNAALRAFRRSQSSELAIQDCVELGRSDCRAGHVPFDGRGPAAFPEIWAC